MHVHALHDYALTTGLNLPLVSDRCSRGEATDLSGPNLAAMVTKRYASSIYNKHHHNEFYALQAFKVDMANTIYSLACSNYPACAHAQQGVK